MKKLTVLSLAAGIAAVATVSCNSDFVPAENTSSSVVVSSFSLSKDDSVMANLDTVFFSIDLNKGKIFNADSLPFGTRTDKLVPVIKMAETVSGATLRVPRADGTDTVYNYITNSTDSIDFSHGPVILTLTSPSGAVTYDYSIQVNVHTLKTDSLSWSAPQRRTLPTDLTALSAQKTAQTLDGLYCLVSSGSAATMAFAETPADDNWDIYSVTLPANADVNSFAATDSELFILADKKLYKSTDGGRAWSDTGNEWEYIYGGYADRLLGARRSGATWLAAEYPAPAAGTVSATLAADMPVAATSQLVPFSLPMSASVQAVMTGGQLANGTLSADTWAFDGNSWTKLSNNPLPAGLRDITLVPFFAFTVNKVFVATKYSVLLAFGGRNNKGVDNTVYISYDYGMTWAKAADLMQLPEFIPAMYGAQAFVFDTVLHSRSAAAWLSFELPMSRATEPITQWDCPYIYLFGGNSADGKLYNTIWRATLNRFTFKPIQ